MTAGKSEISLRLSGHPEVPQVIVILLLSSYYQASVVMTVLEKLFLYPRITQYVMPGAEIQYTLRAQIVKTGNYEGIILF